MRRIFGLLALAATLLVSCDENDQEMATINFELELTNGNEKISIGDTVRLQDEHDFYLSLFRLYLSKIALTTEDGKMETVENVVLLSPANEGENSFSAQVPMESYRKLSVGFGVDPVQNNLNPANFANEHPLSSYQSMYWTMLKYRFAKFEGKASFRNSSTTDIPVSYHPGTDGIYQTRSFDIVLDAAPSYTINMRLDLNKIIDGPAGKIDFATEPSTHSTPGDIHIAEKFMANIAASATVSTGN